MKNLTKTRIDAAQRDLSPGTILFDNEVRTFGVRVNKASASFVIKRSFQSKTRTFTIGKVSAWKLSHAREEAREWIRMLDRGVETQRTFKAPR